MAGVSIKAGKYNEKIRDMIRDFYALGWKTSKDMEGSSAGVSGDVKRIREAIIDENVQWYGWQGEAYRNRTLSLSVDSHRPKDNPFHRAYWYCTHSANDLVFFFGVMLLLSPKTTFAYDKTFLANLFFDEESDVTEADFEEFKKWYVDEKDKLHSLSNKAIRLFLMNQSETPPYGYDDNGDAVLIPTNDYNTVRRRMEELLKLGIVERADGGRKPKGVKEGEHWKLSKCLPGELLRIGRKSDPQFDHHWRELLSFYSRCFIFGEIGTGILRRMDWEASDAIHVLDDYYMQSLSDFVLYDLLSAIEKKQWCVVHYKIGSKAEDHIVKPLQIRIGLTNGRQHLLAFNVNNLQVDALLLSAISTVDIIDDYADICKAYETTRQLPAEQDIDLIIQAKEVELTKLWGVSAPSEYDGKKEYEQVRIVFECEYNKREALFNQLNREKRTGSLVVEGHRIVFNAEVPDGRELIPWIRKYCGYIVSVEGIDPKKYALDEDVKNMFGVMENGINALQVLPGREAAIVSRNDYISNVQPKNRKSEEHSGIFHECFSEEYRLTSKWLMCVLFGEDGCASDVISDNDMIAAFQQVCEERDWADASNGNRDVQERLYDELMQLVDETRIFRIASDSDRRMGRREFTQLLFVEAVDDGRTLSFYQDILPFTTAERRWIVSILNESKSHMFLSDETIRTLTDYLDAAPFSMDKVVYYDRPLTTEDKISSIIPVLLQAISSQNKIALTINDGDEYAAFCGSPLFIEYSKREDEFRLIVEPDGSCLDEWKKARVLSIDCIDRVQLTDEQICREDALKRYNEVVSRRLELKIEFVDAKNLANRLFTEMAPWERQSSKVSEQVGIFDPLEDQVVSYDQYIMKLRYDEADKESLVRKLLSVGPYLQLSESEKLKCVSAEYRNRLVKQMEMLAGLQEG